jgi:hypothetical protein
VKKIELNSAGLHITESVSGVYFYHLAEVSTNAVGLCGARTMNTQIPMASWGARDHLSEKWCSRCASMGADALRRAGVEVATT